MIKFITRYFRMRQEKRLRFFLVHNDTESLKKINNNNANDPFGFCLTSSHGIKCGQCEGCLNKFVCSSEITKGN